MKYKDEMVQEIEEMVSLMVAEGFTEYRDLLINGTNLKECSQTKLAQIRKRSQIYLHQAYIVKKQEITDRMNEINGILDNSKLIQQLISFVVNMNNKDYNNIKSISGYYGLDDIANFMSDINRLKKKGLLQGTIEIKSDLIVPDFDVQKLDLLKEKLELVKKAQIYDRQLQTHLGKQAKCIVEDSVHIRSIQNIQKEIKELTK